VTPSPQNPRRNLIAAIAALFVLGFFIHLILLARATSLTWDEADHTYAGYMSWRHADFGINPQHPPLVKYLATLPLLSMHLEEPTRQDRPYRLEEVLNGRNLLFRNDADTISLRTRIAASLLTVLLVILMFLFTQEMFSSNAGLIALALVTFDPTLLAHGAVVTTDAGQACFMVAAIYAFYRYVKSPTNARLILTGLATGLALASKHSAVLLFPTLATLAALEVLANKQSPRTKLALRYIASLAIITAVSIVVLWASYGFRFAARPEGFHLNPSFSAMLQRVPSATDAHALALAERLHLLPESYLYGFAHVLIMSRAFTTYLLGTIYPHPIWFYFPIAMVIKSTLTFLILLVIALWAIATGKVSHRRELAFALVPAAIYMIFAMAGGMNIGIRHILPVYIFLIIAIAGATAALIERNRRWLYVTAALLIFQAISVTLTFPGYVAYANEAVGGINNVHNLLSDSSSDWGQQMKSVRRYLERNNIHQCWFIYFGEGVIDPNYYNLPCKYLPTADGLHFPDPIDTPTSIDGPVLVSASVLSGFEFGPGALNPYEQFKHLTPAASIDGGVFVFNGHFEIPLAAALTHVQRAELLLKQNQLPQALTEAQQALALAPDSARTNLTMGEVLDASNQRTEARPYYERALQIAQTVEPRFQESTLKTLQHRLAEK
jgi:4-amino-4-deoxy-L-arabinose transferase-like glycosyltransferase